MCAISRDVPVRRRSLKALFCAVIVTLGGCVRIPTLSDKTETPVVHEKMATLPFKVLGGIYPRPISAPVAAAAPVVGPVAGVKANPITGVLGVGSNPVEQSNNIFPFIPWPPPRSTSSYKFSPNLLEKFVGHSVSVFSDYLEAKLRESGYDCVSYFTAPGGFILATELERISDDGARQTIIDDDGPYSFRENFYSYIRRLLTNKIGRFRIIVFVLTDNNNPESTKAASFDDAKRWAHTGVKFLPEKVSKIALTDKQRFYALVYEFNAIKGRPTEMLDSSDIPPYRHLQKIATRLNNE